MTLKPNNIVIMNDQIAIKWNDASESLIDNKTLRLQCPCANCSGESDVFGTIYKSNNLKTNNENTNL